jgi:hypothetical protein
MDKLPECPVCWSNKAVCTGKWFYSELLCCDEQKGGCGAIANINTATPEKGITLWAKAEEKRKALTPKLSEKLPDEPGRYWWTNDLEHDPIIVSVTRGMDGYLYDILHHDLRVVKIGGYWAKVQMPEMPEGEE